MIILLVSANVWSWMRWPKTTLPPPPFPRLPPLFLADIVKYVVGDFSRKILDKSRGRANCGEGTEKPDGSRCLQRRRWVAFFELCSCLLGNTHFYTEKILISDVLWPPRFVLFPFCSMNACSLRIWQISWMLPDKLGWYWCLESKKRGDFYVWFHIDLPENILLVSCRASDAKWKHVRLIGSSASNRGELQLLQCSR